MIAKSMAIQHVNKEVDVSVVSTTVNESNDQLTSSILSENRNISPASIASANKVKNQELEQIQSKPAQVSRQQSSKPIKEIQISMTCFNKAQPINFSVPISMTGFDLRVHIWEHFSQELQIKRMQLVCDSQEILPNLFLSERFGKITENKCYQITQKRARLENISKIKVINKTCEILDETKSCLLLCKHNIGAEAMRFFLKKQIAEKKSVLHCPLFTDEGLPCTQELNMDQVKRIAVLTTSEWQQLECELSLNSLVKNNWKNCPFCKNACNPNGLKSNRVHCAHPDCQGKGSDFCYFCLQPWKHCSDRCGSENCQFLNSWLKSAVMKKFSLKDSSGKFNEYDVPNIRACPRCGQIYEHKIGCKHFTCALRCNPKMFCFVCLSLADEQDIFKCGDYETYCGKVAPIQKF